MQDVDTSLTDFSKHLLVTIFAIFAFTSGALLGASNCWVKLSFISSLILAVLSMSCGFKVVMEKVNYYLDDSNDKKARLPNNVVRKMKTKLQWQYYWSVAALFLLIVSVSIYFLTENYYLISVKP